MSEISDQEIDLEAMLFEAASSEPCPSNIVSQLIQAVSDDAAREELADGLAMDVMAACTSLPAASRIQEVLINAIVVEARLSHSSCETFPNEILVILCETLSNLLTSFHELLHASQDIFHDSIMGSFVQSFSDLIVEGFLTVARLPEKYDDVAQGVSLPAILYAHQVHLLECASTDDAVIQGQIIRIYAACLNGEVTCANDIALWESSRSVVEILTQVQFHAHIAPAMNDTLVNMTTTTQASEFLQTCCVFITLLTHCGKGSYLERSIDETGIVSIMVDTSMELLIEMVPSSEEVASIVSELLCAIVRACPKRGLLVVANALIDALSVDGTMIGNPHECHSFLLRVTQCLEKVANVGLQVEDRGVNDEKWCEVSFRVIALLKCMGGDMVKLALGLWEEIYIISGGEASHITPLHSSSSAFGDTIIHTVMTKPIKRGSDDGTIDSIEEKIASKQRKEARKTEAAEPIADMSNTTTTSSNGRQQPREPAQEIDALERRIIAKLSGGTASSNVNVKSKPNDEAVSKTAFRSSTKSTDSDNVPGIKHVASNNSFNARLTSKQQGATGMTTDTSNSKASLRQSSNSYHSDSIEKSQHSTFSNASSREKAAGLDNLDSRINAKLSSGMGEARGSKENIQEMLRDAAKYPLSGTQYVPLQDEVAEDEEDGYGVADHQYLKRASAIPPYSPTSSSSERQSGDVKIPQTLEDRIRLKMAGQEGGNESKDRSTHAVTNERQESVASSINTEARINLKIQKSRSDIQDGGVVGNGNNDVEERIRRKTGQNVHERGDVGNGNADVEERIRRKTGQAGSPNSSTPNVSENERIRKKVNGGQHADDDDNDSGLIELDDRIATKLNPKAQAQEDYTNEPTVLEESSEVYDMANIFNSSRRVQTASNLPSTEMVGLLMEMGDEEPVMNANVSVAHVTVEPARESYLDSANEFNLLESQPNSSSRSGKTPTVEDDTVAVAMAIEDGDSDDFNEAVSYDPAQKTRINKKIQRWTGVSFLAGIVVAIILGVLLSRKKLKENEEVFTDAPSLAPTGATHGEISLLIRDEFGPDESYDDKNTAYGKAFDWITHDVFALATVEANGSFQLQTRRKEEVVVNDIYQRFLCGLLYFEMWGEAWVNCSATEKVAEGNVTDAVSSETCSYLDREYQLVEGKSKWLSPVGICAWAGITCNNNKRVVELDLSK